MQLPLTSILMRRVNCAKNYYATAIASQLLYVTIIVDIHCVQPLGFFFCFFCLIFIVTKAKTTNKLLTTGRHSCNSCMNLCLQAFIDWLTACCVYNNLLPLLLLLMLSRAAAARRSLQCLLLTVIEVINTFAAVLFQTISPIYICTDIHIVCIHWAPEVNQHQK